MKHQVRIENEYVIISISGDVDLEFSGDLRIVLMENLPKGRTIIVDLAGVNLIDSSGIASLLEAFQNAKKKGKDFIVTSVNSPVMRVFNLARLETVFNIKDNIESALSR